MKIKICGITNIEDALMAAELGADLLGFIFVQKSPRYVTPEIAKDIIARLPQTITKVGVFADAKREKVSKIINETKINYLQFHGNEQPQDILGYDISTIKAFRVSDNFNPEILKQYNASAFLLDTFVDGTLGGTGKTFNWDIAIEAKKYGNIILSGGLNPNNIADAIKKVNPYAIDVNSGVESSPGKKDEKKLKELFEIVKEG